MSTVKDTRRPGKRARSLARADARVGSSIDLIERLVGGSGVYPPKGGRKTVTNRHEERSRLHRARTCVDSSTPLEARDRIDRRHADAARNYGRYLVRTSLSSHLFSSIGRLLIRV
jgi:hypothetical protein